jgi:hypothetical protein
MRASIGDRLLVHGSKAGERDRACTVLGFWDPGGEPPYFVQWYDTGDSAILMPPPDEAIVNRGASSL